MNKIAETQAMKVLWLLSELALVVNEFRYDSGTLEEAEAKRAEISRRQKVVEAALDNELSLLFSDEISSLHRRLSLLTTEQTASLFLSKYIVTHCS